VMGFEISVDIEPAVLDIGSLLIFID